MRAGEPVIPVFASAVGPEELAAVAEVMERQWLGFGPKVEAFERALAERLGIAGLVMVDSGSNALYLALHLLRGQRVPGDEVVLPAFTWVSCAHAVVLAGYRPVFCDVEPLTGNVSRATIEPWVSERTAAIMVVHYAGRPVDMDPVLALGKPVIEDAAHAVDSRYAGRACGGMGDLGIYSFDAVKNLSAAEGGGLTARDPALLERARELRYCGIGRSGYQAARGDAGRWWEHRIVEPFIKMLPTDLGAAIALAQLAKLDRLQAARAARWSEYDALLAALPWVRRPPGAALPAGSRHSYFTYLVQVPMRDALARHLLEHGVYTTLRYHPLHLTPPYSAPAPLPHTEHLARHGLNLPLHPRLGTDDVRRVVEAMAGFGAAHGL